MTWHPRGRATPARTRRCRTTRRRPARAARHRRPRTTACRAGRAASTGRRRARACRAAASGPCLARVEREKETCVYGVAGVGRGPHLLPSLPGLKGARLAPAAACADGWQSNRGQPSSTFDFHPSAGGLRHGPIHPTRMHLPLSITSGCPRRRRGVSFRKSPQAEPSADEAMPLPSSHSGHAAAQHEMIPTMPRSMPILAISAALLLLAAPPPASAALPAPGGPLAAALANNAHSLALLKRQRPEDCQWCPDRETGICVYLSSNVAHCGKCGAPCSAGEFCYMGRCRTNEAWCAEQGYQSCPGTPDFACLSDTTPEACGTCGTVCSGATPYCQGGRCTQCLDGDLVCGGVCTALGTDNCGSCNRACPNGTYCNVYVDGKMNPGPYECVPLECGFGTSWCPGLGCVDFRNNDRHCGGCNAACAAGEQCLAGECRPCNATEGGASCGGRCTSLRTDSKNCGSCGRACQFGEMCWEGECGCPSYAQGPAPPNVVDCPLGNGTVERCVDLANRGDHCGACGARCPSKETGSQWMGWCDNGRCDCYPPGTGSRYTPSLTLCGSVCTPTETDGENCGRCSNVCGPGRACHKGECFACERLGMLACAGMDGTCMAPGEYDYRCPAGSLYTSTTASTAGTATATGSATTARPTETVAPPAFAVPPGNATCMRSCPDKGNFLLVRPVLLEGSRLATVQCIGPDGGKCAWFTDAECRSVAPGESAPAPSYDVGYLCSQNTAGWCGAAYGYLWTAPGTPIPGSCPAPAPPTSTEAAVSAGSFTCVRSCLDKGNYLLARTQVERVSSVMTVQCSGTSPTSCGWFSDAACTQVVPGETGGGASGVACAQVEDGWCRAAWNVAALGLPQQNCSFVPTATDSGASATSAPREPTRGSGATAAGTPSSTGAPTAAATPSGSPAAVLTTTNGRPSSAGRVLRGAGSWVPVLLSLGALIAWP